jgi:hypothetical protein
MGRVTAVHLREGKPAEAIAVAFKLAAGVTLFTDATIVINGPLIGDTTYLDILEVGTVDAGEPTGPIIGAAGGGMLASVLGADTAEAFEELKADALDFGDLLARMDEEYNERVVPILDNLTASSEDVREVIADARDVRWPAWADNVDEIFVWADGMTGELDATVATGRGLLTEARETLDANREKIDNIVANTESASVDISELAAHLNSETVAKLDSLLERGRVAMDEAVTTITEARTSFTTWSAQTDEILADLSLAAGQLKFGLMEVRRNPWKLVYRPTDAEFDHELLYEATRAFAMAAADLKASSGSFSRLLEHGGEQLAGDEERLQRMSEGLRASFERYEAAQEQLLDVLTEEY